MPAAVSLWTKSVAQLNHAVLLWIAIFSNNSAAMAKLVNSDAIPEGYRAAKDGLTLSWEDQPLPDNADPAEHLKRSANTYLGAALNAAIEGEVRRQVYFREPEQLAVHEGPTTLLAALWLQLMRAVEGTRRFNKCKQCDMWMEMTPGINRRDKEVCSLACKQKAYRKVVAAVRQMDRAGMPARDIAKTVRRDLSTVER